MSKRKLPGGIWTAQCAHCAMQLRATHTTTIIWHSVPTSQDILVYHLTVTHVFIFIFTSTITLISHHNQFLQLWWSAIGQPMVIMVSCQTRAPLPRIEYQVRVQTEIRNRIWANLKINEKNKRHKQSSFFACCDGDIVKWKAELGLTKMTFGWQEDDIWMRVAFTLKLPSRPCQLACQCQWAVTRHLQERNRQDGYSSIWHHV